MTNWNLENFDNIYASLAESSYTTRPFSLATLMHILHFPNILSLGVFHT